MSKLSFLRLALVSYCFLQSKFPPLKLAYTGVYVCMHDHVSICAHIYTLNRRMLSKRGPTENTRRKDLTEGR